MLLLSLLIRQQRQMQLSMLCYRLFKLLLKSSIWHAHFFSPNNKRAIKHNSCCTWTAHRYLTTSQNCQKHATYCLRAGLYRLYSHNRKWYLQDGLISQSTQHIFHTKTWKKQPLFSWQWWAGRPSSLARVTSDLVTCEVVNIHSQKSMNKINYKIDQISTAYGARIWLIF